MTFSIKSQYYRAIFKNIAILSPKENIAIFSANNIANPQNGNNIAMLVTELCSYICNMVDAP
jgi:hypothetical protein